MRITSKILQKLANDFISQQVRSDRGILAVYLYGSILKEPAVLGGTTDVDLFYIHSGEMKTGREIIRITDDVHMDIAHHPREQYRQTHDLRLHPWLGPTIYHCEILYDPQHFMDFIQASVRGQFHTPENILRRARVQVEHARQIWFEFQFTTGASQPDELLKYLHAIELSANSVAVLSGPPLTERRFLLHFVERARALNRPGLYPAVLGLLGGTSITPEALQSWLPAWQAAFNALPPERTPARLSPYRKPYYVRAFEAILEDNQPLAALWPLWFTWTRMIPLLPGESSHHEAWEAAGNALGLLGESFADRIAALDQYLDQVEETLEAWALDNGIS
jgi:hypothetical protein